jgi:diazepam-binding inhibitor (GABA receptor modulating acyl-CoA-binding protein)
MYKCPVDVLWPGCETPQILWDPRAFDDAPLMLVFHQRAFALDVTHGESKEGATVIVAPTTGRETQVWTVRYHGNDGSFALVHAATNLAIQVPPRNQIHTSDFVDPKYATPSILQKLDDLSAADDAFAGGYRYPQGLCLRLAPYTGDLLQRFFWRDYQWISHGASRDSTTEMTVHIPHSNVYVEWGSTATFAAPVVLLARPSAPKQQLSLKRVMEFRYPLRYVIPSRVARGVDPRVEQLRTKLREDYADVYAVLEAQEEELTRVYTRMEQLTQTLDQLRMDTVPVTGPPQYDDEFVQVSKPKPNPTTTRFTAAAQRAKELFGLSTLQKISLYKFYQQATVGDNTTPRPGIFDQGGRLYWDAWDALRGMAKVDAQQCYIDLVHAYEAGWSL